MPKKPEKHGDDQQRDGADELSYEDAVERLEAIIERIESGQAGIEESISLYEQGTGLLRRCREILSKAEQRIEKIGNIAERPPQQTQEQRDTQA